MTQEDKEDAAELRRHLRQMRGALTFEDQSRAADMLFNTVHDLQFYRQGTKLAFYFPTAGEIPPGSLLQHSLDAGKHCYMPVVANGYDLTFVRYVHGTKLEKNRWGILEPIEGETIEPRSLDVVFVPLLGFSSTCYRLGRGKGFYDRAFAFRATAPHEPPTLIGLAHDFQLVKSLPVEPWDVPLDAVMTPRRIFQRGG